MLESSLESRGRRTQSRRGGYKGEVGVLYKCLEALRVLTISSKRVEARRIAAEYLFPH